jgi:hypothetical protein
MKHSLEALLRRMSRIAEQMFDEHGEILPSIMWLIERRDGKQEIISSGMLDVPPPGPEFDRKKNQLAEAMRQFFEENDIVRYASAAECWMGADIAPGSWPTCRPSEDRQREEVVAFDADDGHEYLVAMRKIIRPQHGKPYLDKLEFSDQNMPFGRFTNLLPSRTQDRERQAQ